MEKQRLSFDMSAEDHKYLKMCCAKLGISLKEFIIKAINEKVDEHEDIWFSELPEEKNASGQNYVLIDHQGKMYGL